MKLASYIRPECFIPDLGEAKREDALRVMVHAVAEKGLIKDERDVFATLMRRENIQNTAAGHGIAMLHCFIEEIPNLLIVVARAHDGIDLHSSDGMRTQAIFLLMGSATSTQDLVQALAEEEARLC
jgi:PTS system nitrogen regulatory IIA component